MADQIERLIEAVNKVARNITRLSTYSNKISLAGIITAISNAVGSLVCRYFVGGAVMSSSSGVSGSMDIAKLLDGSGDGYGLVPDMNISISRQLSGSVIGVSGLESVTISYNGQSKSIVGVCAAKTIIGHAVLEV